MPKAIVSMSSLRDGKGGLAVLSDDGTWRDVSVPWVQPPDVILSEHESACAAAAKKVPPAKPPSKPKIVQYAEVDEKHTAVGNMFPRLDARQISEANTAVRAFIEKTPVGRLAPAECLYMDCMPC